MFEPCRYCIWWGHRVTTSVLSLHHIIWHTFSDLLSGGECFMGFFWKKKKKNAVCWVTVQTFPSSLYIKSHDSWGPLKAGGGNLLPLSDGLVVNVWGFMPLNKNYVTLSPCGRISVSLGGLNRPSPPQLSCGVSRFVPVIQSQTHTTSDLAHAWFT